MISLLLALALAGPRSGEPSVALAARLSELGYSGFETDAAHVSFEETRGLIASDAVFLKFGEGPDGSILVSAWPVRNGDFLAAEEISRETLLNILASNEASEAAAMIDEDGDLGVALRIDPARWRGANLHRLLDGLVARADGLAAEVTPIAQGEDTNAILFELTWTTDADLDLDLYGPDSSYLATAAELPPDARDITDGAQGTERIQFSGRLARDSYLVVVSFWAAGPSGQPSAEATIRIRKRDGEVIQIRRVLEIPGRKEWWAALVEPARDRVVIRER